jgi:hypothetical protein
MCLRQILALFFLLCGFLATKTYGQVVATWTDGNGNWSNAASWSTNTVPNNSGGTMYDVGIIGTGSDTVTFDVGGTVVNSLFIGPGETLQQGSSAPNLNTGLLTFGGNSTVNWVGGGTLATGPVNMVGGSDTINISNSALSVNGDLALSPNSVLSLDNSNAGISGSVLSSRNSNPSLAVNSSNLTIGGNFEADQSGGVIQNSNVKVQGNFTLYQTLNSGQSLSVINSAFQVGGNLMLGEESVAIFNNSSVQIYRGVTMNDSVYFPAQVVIQNGSLLNVHGGYLSGYGGSGLTISGGSLLSVTGGFGNLGTINISNSILTVAGGINNGSLFGFLSNPGIYVDAGSSLMVSSGGFNNGSNWNFGLSGVASVVGGFVNSGGSVLVSQNAILTADSYSQGSGATDISGVLSTSSYRQSGGYTTIESGGLIKANTFSATGGTITVNGILDPTAVELDSGAALQGTGAIIGNLAMGGTIMPGAAGTPGTFTIFGNYEQIGNGTFDELIGANSASFLNVNGDAALDFDSLLNITLLNGYDPLGQTFGIMDYRSLIGQFSNDSSFLDDGYVWDISYGKNEIYVTAVGTPEPGSLLLLFVGLSALAFCAHRKLEKARRLV